MVCGVVHAQRLQYDDSIAQLDVIHHGRQSYRSVFTRESVARRECGTVDP
jgi:hypothetical protein